jgi:uncharacterized protein (DUF952 family)
MAVIYHISTQPEWDAALQAGSYTTPSLQDEGFIHCCEKQQINGVLGRYFKGKTGLVFLSIDTEKLQSRLVYEWSPAGQDTFPHIYGPINTDAVIKVEL